MNRWAIFFRPPGWETVRGDPVHVQLKGAQLRIFGRCDWGFGCASPQPASGHLLPGGEGTGTLWELHKERAATLIILLRQSSLRLRASAGYNLFGIRDLENREGTPAEAQKRGENGSTAESWRKFELWECPPIQIGVIHACDGGQMVAAHTQGSVRLGGSRNPWAKRFKPFGLVSGSYVLGSRYFGARKASFVPDGTRFKIRTTHR